MTLRVITAAEALRSLGYFDTIIDARSPSEYALDHLPNADNWPTLNDPERQRVGILYKQVGAFEAKKLGASLAAINIGHHIATQAQDQPKHWTPLLYCWRGGKRSGSLALVMDQIGFQVTLLEGGYKAFRAALVHDIARLSQSLDFRVICGTTGCGKTRLLHALANQGAQTLDLEQLAKHRSSVLGLVPDTAQPCQKAFDTAIWYALTQLQPNRPVFVESESKKVGNLAIPSLLMDAIRAAPCMTLEMPLDARIALLMQDYPHFVYNPVFFSQRLEALTQLLGKALIANWQQQLAKGEVREVVSALLTRHYDPIYLASMQRNFKQSALGPHYTLLSHAPAEFENLARRLMQSL